jgi:hypothetical protein
MVRSSHVRKVVCLAGNFLQDVHWREGAPVVRTGDPAQPSGALLERTTVLTRFKNG